jgi:hypothetical protein
MIGREEVVDLKFMARARAEISKHAPTLCEKLPPFPIYRWVVVVSHVVDPIARITTALVCG